MLSILGINPSKNKLINGNFPLIQIEDHITCPKERLATLEVVQHILINLQPFQPRICLIKDRMTIDFLKQFQKKL